MAIRIGQRIGLHRDGTTLGLPPFQTELRRRVWWQILLLDGRAAELAGSGVSIVPHLTDTKLPSNVNDGELYPDMLDPPVEHVRPTEMLFPLIRFEFGEFIRRSKFTDAFDGSWQNLSSTHIPLSVKDSVIDELEQILEHKFLKYCDPIIPLHLLSSGMARAAICRMRLMIHHPQQYAARGMQIPEKERETLFANSLRMIEYDNLGHSSQSLRGFLWHMDMHFQWNAFIYLLSELRCRLSGAEVNQAWKQVEEIFVHHPQIISNTKTSLHGAICTLALKAFEARDAYYQQRGEIPSKWPPHFVSTLYSHDTSRNPSKAIEGIFNNEGTIASTEHVETHVQVTHEPKADEASFSETFDNFDPTFLTDPLTFDPSTINWTEWHSLLHDFSGAS
jgi:hypothetical protein